MDIWEQIDEWAEEEYPDDLDLQHHFKEGCYKSLEVLTLAAATIALRDGRVAE